jgi:hypothetical protein
VCNTIEKLIGVSATADASDTFASRPWWNKCAFQPIDCDSRPITLQLAEPRTAHGPLSRALAKSQPIGVNAHFIRCRHSVTSSPNSYSETERAEYKAEHQAGHPQVCSHPRHCTRGPRRRVRRFHGTAPGRMQRGRNSGMGPDLRSRNHSSHGNPRGHHGHRPQLALAGSLGVQEGASGPGPRKSAALTWPKFAMFGEKTHFDRSARRVPYTGSFPPLRDAS